MRIITMVHITVSDKPVLQHTAGSYLVCVHEESDISKQLKSWTGYCDALPAILQAREFTGKSLQLLSVPVSIDERVVFLILLGLGKRPEKQKIEVERYRRAIAKGIKEAVRLKTATVVIDMPAPTVFGVDASYLASQTIEISMMASYHFDDFIT